MASPSPARKRTAFLFSATSFASGTTATTEVADCLGLPMRPIGVFYQVVTGVTVAVAPCVLSWQADPGGSAIRSWAWSQPVEAADIQGFITFNVNDDAGTTVGTGGPTSAYGIDTNLRLTGEVEDNSIVGPGGEWLLTVSAGASAGAVNYWLVYEQLDLADEAQDEAITRVNATTIP